MKFSHGIQYKMYGEQTAVSYQIFTSGSSNFFFNVLSLQEWAGVPDTEFCIVNVSIYLSFQELLHQNFKQKLSVQ